MMRNRGGVWGGFRYRYGVGVERLVVVSVPERQSRFNSQSRKRGDGVGRDDAWGYTV